MKNSDFIKRPFGNHGSGMSVWMSRNASGEISQITDKITVVKTDDKAVEMRVRKWLVIRFTLTINY